MEEIFPHKWSSKVGSVGSSAFKTWHKGLGDLSAEQLANGLNACVHTGEDWPPSLPRFRAMCLGEDKQKVENLAVYQRPECLALPKSRPSKDHARAYLQALKEALGKSCQI